MVQRKSREGGPLIVHVVKTRAGGPTARLLAGCRAAGPFVWLVSGKYFGFDAMSITLLFFLFDYALACFCLKKNKPLALFWGMFPPCQNWLLRTLVWRGEG